MIKGRLFLDREISSLGGTRGPYCDSPSSGKDKSFALDSEQ